MRSFCCYRDWYLTYRYAYLLVCTAMDGLDRMNERSSRAESRSVCLSHHPLRGSTSQNFSPPALDTRPSTIGPNHHRGSHLTIYHTTIYYHTTINHHVGTRRPCTTLLSLSVVLILPLDDPTTFSLLLLVLSG
jgi:hypothetical protein